MRIETLIYFLLWAALLVAMLRFGCGAHVMGHGRRQHRRGTDGADGALRWIAPEKDIDPVCGMTVATAGAKSSVHGGHVYYFCSPDCRDTFEANPHAYVKSTATSSKPEDPEHGSHHAA